MLAENVANADTPNFRPRDLARRTSQGRPRRRALAALIGAHRGRDILPLRRRRSTCATASPGGYEVRPAGNAVNLEDEMMKVAANQMDYQAATSLYTRSLGLLKTAIGKR